MESNKSLEKKVGIFVVVSVATLLIIIFSLGGDKTFFRSYQKMKVNLEETSGLNKGGVVQMAGLAVGNVIDIDFDGTSNLLAVTIKVDKRYVGKITKGSTASIRTQGALGDKFIMIKPGPSTAEPLKEGDFIPAEEDSDLLSTLGRSGGHIEKVFEIFDKVNKIVSELDQGHFAKNVSDSTRSLKNSMASLDETLATNKLKAALTHFASIMEKIDKGQGTLGGLINDPTVHEDMKALLGGAKRSSLLKYLIRQTIQKNDENETQEKKK